MCIEIESIKDLNYREMKPTHTCNGYTTKSTILAQYLQAKALHKI